METRLTETGTRKLERLYRSVARERLVRAVRGGSFAGGGIPLPASDTLPATYTVCNECHCCSSPVPAEFLFLTCSWNVFGFRLCPPTSNGHIMGNFRHNLPANVRVKDKGKTKGHNHLCIIWNITRKSGKHISSEIGDCLPPCFII